MKIKFDSQDTGILEDTIYWTSSSHCGDKRYMQNSDVETRRNTATSKTLEDNEGKKLKRGTLFFV